MSNLLQRYPIACIIGVITLVEIIVSGDMGGALLLWIGYGVYKIMTS